MKLFLISGTRPEVIKLAPLYLELKKTNIDVSWVASGQHGDLQSQALKFFNIEADYILPKIERESLAELYGKLICQLSELFLKDNFDGIIIQGDTATAFSAAWAGYLLKKKIFYVEAGLRSNDLNAPFPEEANRKQISMIADICFAPTKFDELNLLKDLIPKEKIYVVGNTVVDSLHLLSDLIKTQKIIVSSEIKNLAKSIKSKNKKLILFTMHRRESIETLANKILEQISFELSQEVHNDFMLVYISHPNKDFLFIKKFFEQRIDADKLIILEPQDYQNVIFLLENSFLILSDSGGLFEEAVSIGKPIICLREKSERFFKESMKSAWLLGEDINNFHQIFTEAKNLANSSFSFDKSIFGDGQASIKIVNVIKKLF